MSENKIGFALVHEICPICGKPMNEQILMNSILSKKYAKEIENVHGKAIGYSKTACEDCSKYKDEAVNNLAYGRQKMTELGRTLMTDPKLILLDEPAAGLNPSERKEFIDIIQKVYEKDVDMFLIEHNMDVVMNLSHDITVLNFGCKIAEGSPKEIQQNEEVITAYLGEGYRQKMAKEAGTNA